ncbi:hypothetical protein [Streptomyces sp. t39]|uniref:hypothetical protein n=1 Tax=Streptomyces sp. t39 TaxID=1828156 RepID=UPI0011CD6D50|nr:hypothetical protein [Streptomyces sp. t39]TXS52044.1 hypothetical protein EAO77_22010 [Streptomyces sp. t39]
MRKITRAATTLATTAVLLTCTTGGPAVAAPVTDGGAGQGLAALQPALVALLAFVRRILL